MRKRWWWMSGLCVAALLAAPPAPARQGWDGLAQRLTPAQLAEIGLTPRQLELLDRYLADTVPAAPAPGQGRADGRGADAGGGGGALDFIGRGEGPIHARLTGAVDGWAPGTVFELDNGQQWKVLKGHMRLRQALQAPEIVVVPGLAGRWFLQVREDLPKARVYRVD